MKNAKDPMIAEMSTKGNPSNDVEHKNNKGGVQMETEGYINEALAKSPIRKGRYQYMRDYLQSKGEYHFSNTSHQRFHGMTREQSEQALDDVMLLGYGRVKRVYFDGGLVIEFIDKEKKAKKPEIKNQIETK